MSKSVESPEAAQFPGQSEKLSIVLDTLIVKHASNILLSKFKNTYGYQLINEGEQYVGSGLYDVKRDMQEFLELAERSNNSFVLSEAIQTVYKMDSTLIRNDMQMEWIFDRIEIDTMFENIFCTSVWQTYVEICDTKGALNEVQAFCEYQQERLWKRESVLRDKLDEEYKKIESPLHHEDEGLEPKLNEISISDLTNIVDIAILLGDVHELQRVMNIHFELDKAKTYSFFQGYSIRTNIEKLVQSMYAQSPEYVFDLQTTAQHNRKNSDNTLRAQMEYDHIAMVTSFVLKDWKHLVEGVSESYAGEKYKAYLLECIGKLLHDETIEMPSSSRMEIEEYLVNEIRYLEKDVQIDVLCTFQHELLIPTCLEVIDYELGQNYFDTDDLTIVLKYVLLHASEEEKNILLSYMKERLVSEIEQDDPEIGIKDTESLISMSDNELSFVTHIGVQLKDIEMLEHIIEIGFSRLGTHKFGAYQVKEALCKAIPSVIEQGNTFSVNHLLNIATEWYEQLEDMSLAKHIIYDVEKVQFLLDGMPIMLTIFNAIQTYHPRLQVCIGEGKNQYTLHPSHIEENVAEFYEWMAQGVDIYYQISQGWFERSISESLSLARAILKCSKDPLINRRVKMATLSESLRLYALGQYTGAWFYIETILESIGEDWVTEERLLEYTAHTNLKWIVDKLMPYASSSKYLSQN
jgi:hypothetical protein